MSERRAHLTARIPKIAKACARLVARAPFAFARAAVTGGRLSMPSFVSMTLDRDDLEVAQRWSRLRDRWTSYRLAEEFSSVFSRQFGLYESHAFMAGRVALSACLHALNLAPGDEVIVPGYTCVAVPNAVRFAGLKVVYADIELDTYGVDVHRLAAKLTHRTRALLIHHLYGLVCRDLEQLIEFARQHGLFVIEDCAHATGAKFKGRMIGSFGDVSFFSFERSKILNTIQGGVAATTRPDLAEDLRSFWARAPSPSLDRVQKQLANVALDFYECTHRFGWFFKDVACVGFGGERLVSTSENEIRGERPPDYGCRMPDPIAALAQNQFAKLDHYNRLRRETAVRWDLWCDQRGFSRVAVIPQSTPVFLRYPVLVPADRKADLSWARSELGLMPGRWFVSQVHPGPEKVRGCPAAEQAVKQCINLPCLLK